SLSINNILLLLYDSYPNPTQVNDLFTWIEHKNITDFKRKVLKILHNRRLIEYHEDRCVLLQPGIDYVKKNLSQYFG
ncbi:unnamed protein product, partial [marine sediment metagenome]